MIACYETLFPFRAARRECEALRHGRESGGVEKRVEHLFIEVAARYLLRRFQHRQKSQDGLRSSHMEPVARLRRRISRYAAGMTSMDSKGAVIMPPTIGAAMRCMISAPVPLDHMIGNRPARITATVMAF